MRAELDAAELLPAEAAFELRRAAEFEPLRAEPELALRRLELAPVASPSLAAVRLRPPAFGDALCFGLVCLANSPPEGLVPGCSPLYGRFTENTSMQH